MHSHFSGRNIGSDLSSMHNFIVFILFFLLFFLVLACLAWGRDGNGYFQCCVNRRILGPN
uniref:Uncharacterized protein n=1 Tax=Rhizophora mucronata TaxID=61149 RepID=A0A2P2NYZ6_RHIMU